MLQLLYKKKKKRETKSSTPCHVQDVGNSVCRWNRLKQTFANSSSVSVLTPKRGILELVRLEECWSFFTPLIWDMGLFFFSFSFCVWGHGISTSCCLSGVETWSRLYPEFGLGAAGADVLWGLWENCNGWKLIRNITISTNGLFEIGILDTAVAQITPTSVFKVTLWLHPASQRFWNCTFLIWYHLWGICGGFSFLIFPFSSVSHSPRKVLEMNSDTWFPERLISDRWVSSLFSIRLNLKKQREREIWLFIYFYFFYHTRGGKDRDFFTQASRKLDPEFSDAHNQ